MFTLFFLLYYARSSAFPNYPIVIGVPEVFDTLLAAKSFQQSFENAGVSSHENSWQRLRCFISAELITILIEKQGLKTTSIFGQASGLNSLCSFFPLQCCLHMLF